MSTAQNDEKPTNGVQPGDFNGVGAHDHAGGVATQRKPYDYGGNPLAHVNTGDSARLAAFGGELQPGLYKVDTNRKIANPAPLGLCGFALTTFLLSAINLGTRGLSEPNLVIGAAFAYGGLVQLLAGMWYVEEASFVVPKTQQLIRCLGKWPLGWFIFTFLLLILTLRSTVAFFFLFFTLDMAFLMLGIAYLVNDGGKPNTACLRAGGAFGIIAAFAAWYNALAGMADSSNSFFLIPVAHFPWSDKGREKRGKVNNAEARAAQQV
ncbi:hypothetical protein AC578_1338 [Pseudocercospora eumusae]|uniref:GPR1/FUN34/yaaH family protein n=1 Tax=Pseudocercospora eumusae TaxID=321146 RepID=A0A139HUW0_9PEZI|nr:hypothetical protein AC578_1338 [Pseudocercospora eumusae]